jgi:hypothetical protein
MVWVAATFVEPQARRPVPTEVVRSSAHCRPLALGRALRQRCIDLIELRLWLVVVRQSSVPFHLADDRIKGAVGVLRGAEIPQSRMGLGIKVLHERSRQSRFADTSLA